MIAAEQLVGSSRQRPLHNPPGDFVIYGGIVRN